MCFPAAVCSGRSSFPANKASSCFLKPRVIHFSPTLWRIMPPESEYLVSAGLGPQMKQVLTTAVLGKVVLCVLTWCEKGKGTNCFVGHDVMETCQLSKHLQASFLLSAGFWSQIVPFTSVLLNLLDLYLAQILWEPEAECIIEEVQLKGRSDLRSHLKSRPLCWENQGRPQRHEALFLSRGLKLKEKFWGKRKTVAPYSFVSA